MKNKIVTIIQARLNSLRLPHKVLLKIEGKTVLEHVIERVGKSRLCDQICVATTFLKDDLEIVGLCARNGISVYCGSENDVLDRYFQAARVLETDQIVRITSDCPLIDPKIIDKLIELHLFQKADYTSNALKETFPDGLDAEIFNFAALKKAWEETSLFSEREHVTPYIRKHPEFFKLANLSCPRDLSQKRWTLDEETDYKFIKLIYKGLYKKNKFFGTDEIIKFLKRHPEYEKINSAIQRNAGYMESLRRDKVFVQ